MRCRHWPSAVCDLQIHNRAYLSLHEDAALYLPGLYHIIAREDMSNCRRKTLADLSNGNKMCVTEQSAGTFRNDLLTTRRHHKRPQNMVLRFRCIMTGGKHHPQLDRTCARIQSRVQGGHFAMSPL